jgi:hypothetical protein
MASSASAQTPETDIRPNADQLTQDQIKTRFSSGTFDGAYNFGRDGKAQSFYTETHNPDGTVSYTEDGETMPGRWFVRRESLCFTYPSNRMAGGCFRVYQVKNCYYFYTTSIPQAEDELARDYWVARAVPLGETAGCVAAIS